MGMLIAATEVHAFGLHMAKCPTTTDNVTIVGMHTIPVERAINNLAH